MWDAYDTFSKNYIRYISFANVPEDEARTLMTDDIYTEQRLRTVKFDMVRRLHDARLALEVSAGQVEAFIGVAHGTLYRLERFERGIELNFLIKLCHALGLNLDDVYQVYPDNTIDSLKREKVRNLMKQIERLHEMDQKILMGNLKQLECIKKASSKIKEDKEEEKLVYTCDIYTEEMLAKCNRDIVRRLHDERIKQNMSTQDLSIFTGIDKSCISRLEKLERGIGLNFLIKLCHALGLNFDDVYQIYPEHSQYRSGLERELAQMLSILSEDEFAQVESFLLKTLYW